MAPILRYKFFNFVKFQIENLNIFYFPDKNKAREGFFFLKKFLFYIYLIIFCEFMDYGTIFSPVVLF